jgi:hypothetical protein
MIAGAIDFVNSHDTSITRMEFNASGFFLRIDVIGEKRMEVVEVGTCVTVVVEGVVQSPSLNEARAG